VVFNFPLDLIERRVVDATMAKRNYRPDDDKRFKLTDPPPPEEVDHTELIKTIEDPLMVKLLRDFPTQIVKVHLHASVLHINPDEDFTDEVVKKAQEELDNEAKGIETPVAKTYRYLVPPSESLSLSQPQPPLPDDFPLSTYSSSDEDE